MTVFYNKTKSFKGFPIGSILPWSGIQSEVPDGWISCNGGVTLRVQNYPLLYKVLGNTYGGSVNQTFKLPNLNDGTTAAMDIFKGHFTYLQDKGDAHKPEKTNILSDVFWQTVGGSSEGNRPSTTQTNWVSSVDIVGELNNIENLTGQYGDLSLIPGEFTQVLVPAGRRLSDVHIPSHNHTVTSTSSNSHTTTNNRADSCNGGGVTVASCTISTNCTFMNRIVIRGLTGTTMAQMDGPPNEVNFFNTFNTTIVAQGYPIESLRWGGGGFAPCFGGETSSTCYDPVNGADGYTGGDMFSHNGTRRYFWTNLSPGAYVTPTWTQQVSDNLRSFSVVSDHSHGSLSITFSSKYIRVVKPALVNDIKLNTVRINNDTGLNYGFINVNTATPNLTMQYIIKAY